MIRSFSDRDTEAVFDGRCPSRWRSIQAAVERKMQMLDSATSLADLRSPPGNRLERLSGDRRDQYSIRVNSQWRLCFRWIDGGAEDVEIVDYH